MSSFAPALARAVEEQRRTGVAVEDIETLALHDSASLRGIKQLVGLRSLSVGHTAGLRELAGHPTLAALQVIVRGDREPLDAELLTSLPSLRELLLSEVRLGSLRALAELPLRTLTLAHCEVAAQRFVPPASLVELILDGTARLELGGICPELRLVDLWGTDMAPVEWVAQQPAIEELWLIGCQVPTLEPLLATPQPPRWVFMDGNVDADLDRHRATIAALEGRGARFALGSPHDVGIWIPSWDRVSEHEREPLYLSPGWPRARPE